MIFKYCVKCGRKLDGSLKFCIFCGAPIEKKREESDDGERVTLDSLIREEFGADKKLGEGRFDIDTADFEELGRIGAANSADIPSSESSFVQPANQSDTVEPEPERDASTPADSAYAKSDADTTVKPVPQDSALPVYAKATEDECDEKQPTVKSPAEATMANADQGGEIGSEIANKTLDNGEKHSDAFDDIFDNNAEKSVTTAGFFFLQLIFFIPVVGFIASIIASIAAKQNAVLRRFARARLLWGIAIIAFLLVFTVAFDLLIKPALLAQGIEGISVFGLVINIKSLSFFSWLTALFN